jgi:hypothetical protein
VSWALIVNDPLGGEPTAVVSAKAPSEASAKSEGKPEGDGQQHARYDGPAKPGSADATAVKIEKGEPPPPGSKTVTIIDGSSGKRQDIVIPGSGSSGSDNPVGPRSSIDPKLIEKTRHGGIPMIAADGARPSAAYARPRELPANRKDAPRIAIVISGVGISASGTADAFGKLPPTVTFALAPYAADIEKLAARALGENHEVLLQVPMEPFDYPGTERRPPAISDEPHARLCRRHQLHGRALHGLGAGAGADPARDRQARADLCRRRRIDAERRRTSCRQ